MFKSNKLLLFYILVFVCAAIFIKERWLSDTVVTSSKEEQIPKKLTTPEEKAQPQTVHEPQDDHDHDSSQESPLTEDQKKAELEKINAQKDYINKITDTSNALIEELPSSKEKIITFVTSPQKIKNAKHGTVSEMMQQREGAIKVNTLRQLVYNLKSNSEELFSVLQTVKEKSQDPTISLIANEVEKSAKKGRDFFKDFPKAAAKEPLPD